MTKRKLLGFVNGQYDPMGLICPILIILKIHLRELFGPEAELHWDDPIPSDQHETWVKIISMCLHMDDVIISRAVRPANVEGQPELIGFADGSLSAYGCSIYIRWKKVKANPDDLEQFHVKLLCASVRLPHSYTAS